MIATAALWVALAGGPDIYVRPDGSDANPGSRQLPVAHLEMARDLARRLRSHRIYVLPGEYRLAQSFKLDAKDDGLTIEGIAEGGNRPMLTGSFPLPTSGWRPLGSETARVNPSATEKIRVADLSVESVGALTAPERRGFSRAVAASPNELFQDGEPLQVARWPNTGFAEVAQVIEPGNGEKDADKPPRRPIFTTEPNHAAQWATEPDLWVYGYWNFDWADESIHVNAVDPASGRITLDTPHVYGVSKGAKFWVENALSELDAPGEYYVDRSARKLFVYPKPGNGAFRLSTLGQPLMTVDHAANIALRNLDFGYSRGDGVEVRDSQSVQMEGCRLFNLGERAVTISGGTHCGLQSCDVWNTGEGGISLSGGDRKSLTPGAHFIINCDIHHYQRRSQTYRPAVSIGGVGNRVAHCAMHDAPHSAIIYSGNDHIIEYNDFYRTVALTGDGGVVYTGRDWTARGTQIRFNHFFDNVGMRKWEPAIYVDDLGSGIQMVGNLIERCHWGFLIGGGRDNLLAENVLVDCDLGFDCDARGLGWASTSRPTMMSRLEAVPYQSDIWRARYPALATILDDPQPMAPAGNILRDNLLVRSGKFLERMEGPFAKTATISGNHESNDKGRPWFKLPGVPRLPLREMGLQADALRRGLRAPIRS